MSISTAVPNSTITTLDTLAWDLHHQSRILGMLLEQVEKDLAVLKAMVGLDVASFTHLSHSIHQAYEVTASANKFRETVNTLV